MNPVVIGIRTQDELRAGMLSIAWGKYKPKPSDPKTWFTSMRSLAELTGHRTIDLSRTLKTMANYGLIVMLREKNHVRPVAKVTEFLVMA